MKTVFVVVLALTAVLLSAQTAPREQAGPLPGGGFLLSSGWRLQPAGTQIALDTFPMSSALSPDGRYLLVLNGGHKPPSISVIDLREPREISRTPVPDGWLGLAFSPKGDRVYVGGGSRAAVFEFTFSEGVLKPSRTFPVVPEERRTGKDFIGDVALSPDGRLIYAADLFRDSVAVLNPQSGMVIERFKTGRRPYRILFHPDGKSIFVTSWTEGTLYHHDADKGDLLARLRVGAHATDMIWRPKTPGSEEDAIDRLFIAAANTNSVYSVGVSESKELRMLEIINVAFTPRQPLGMTPSALGLSADRKQLLVACSDANAAAVVDLSGPRSGVRGFIPTGWYPTAVRSLPDGRVVVLNGQGGTASVIPPPSGEEIDAYSTTVIANSAYRDSQLFDTGTGAGNPIPSTPGGPTPIRHVVYIVGGNRMNDDNQHKLASEFVLLDNFYVSGPGWSTAAIASDYVRKMAPNSYGGRRQLHDFEGQEPTAVPPAGYLWTNASAAGLSLRNYGHFVDNAATPGPNGEQITGVRDPVLRAVTNFNFRGFDTNYPDAERAKVLLEDVARFEKSGEMPRLLLVQLSGGVSRNGALGVILEGLGKSRFWPEMAIFVLPNDVQNGSPERAPAFVVSPYARRGIVDSTMYDAASVLRTVELILALRPMTHFDAGARPLSAAFQAAPDLAPYSAAP